MELDKLKARAYECVVQISTWQKQLVQIEQQIAQEMNKPKEKPKGK